MSPIAANRRHLTGWAWALAGLVSTIVLAPSVLGQPQFQNTWRVDASVVDGAENGTSWADAFRHLQDALSAAAESSGNDQIWVAAGTYYPDRNSVSPDGTGDRNASFGLLTEVSIYGGFLGLNHPSLPNGETGLLQRDPELNTTILSGDIDEDDVNDAENSLHVVSANSVLTTAVLNGVHVAGGNADFGRGGGLLVDSADPRIVRCRFEDNRASRGGAVGFGSIGGEPVFVNCRFVNNIAAQKGGPCTVR